MPSLLLLLISERWLTGGKTSSIGLLRPVLLLLHLLP